jgi:hypothetical protein
MSTGTSIERAGERHAVDWLKAEGYSITKWDTQASGASEIEAQSDLKRLLVHVKAAAYPNYPSKLSAEEERAFTARAAGLGAQAWEARVQVGSNLELVGNVEWRRILIKTSN